ncbi:MAG: uncharacterized protein KVP18_001056 [Porospora cf. gigantea A]|uniref:uncharacterized protein n=1 Tax=Porospora cf. gigantea A TaxID=2853593 RepID=UPI003559A1B6|nr:MAG: hypothetical protein KVP18_001056 [Porospora cf. gigantea A]
MYLVCDVVDFQVNAGREEFKVLWVKDSSCPEAEESWEPVSNINAGRELHRKMLRLRREYMTRGDVDHIEAIPVCRVRDATRKCASPPLPGMENEEGAPVFGVEGGRPSVAADEKLSPLLQSRRLHMVAPMGADFWAEKLMELPVFGVEGGRRSIQPDDLSEATHEGFAEIPADVVIPTASPSGFAEDSPLAVCKRSEITCNLFEDLTEDSFGESWYLTNHELTPLRTTERIEGGTVGTTDYRLVTVVNDSHGSRIDELTFVQARKHRPSALLDYLLRRLHPLPQNLSPEDQQLFRDLRSSYS